MKSKLTRSKVSPKSHKKVIAFIYAEELVGEDINLLESYLEKRNDLHFIYIIVSKSPSQKVRTVCNRYHHLKLIYSREPEIQISDIKNQYDGDEVKFEDRNFDDLKN